MGLSTILTASLLALRLFSVPAVAVPAPSPAADSKAVAAATSWWLPNIPRVGTVPYSNAGSGYQIYRNVQSFGAKGDGVTDDTAAINAALSSGNRCGAGCDSQTTTPAIVYFPPGTYIVSSPIQLYYYTHLIGDATNLPTLKASRNFAGIAVIDSNPGWYGATNNFFRQIRNFKIDLTGQPINTGTGIRWRVAQATSIQNVQFIMSTDTSTNNKQQGLWGEDGSGGWLSDLTFTGGALGMWVGNQQFTSRNLVFNGCQTAIYMNWNWLWSFHGITINNANVGIDMSGTDGNGIQQVGSILLADSKISNTKVGVLTNHDLNQAGTYGTLVLDNVDLTTNTPIAVKNARSGATLLGGNANIASWTQGRAYTNNNGKAVQGTRATVSKPAALTAGGKVFTRSRPQYENVAASNFLSVKSRGAKGDGSTDDTKAIQAVFDSATANQIVYFDHGAYVVTDTIKVPKNIKIVGEVWALIMVGGTKFKDINNPQPVWQVGQPGDVGNVEIQDIMFETLGPQPGAIIVQWNVAGSSQGAAGLWDVHFRIGGSAGTQLQSDRCVKTPNQTTNPNPSCFGAFLLLHVTTSGSIYMENTWLWVSDHELDLADHSQVNIYNGRGLLIESTKGTWLWGTASEHSVLYNYALNNAQNVYANILQTETAYMQGNPDARVPFTSQSKYGDPDWSSCTTSTCARTYGIRIVNSSNTLIYGAGMYSFFNNYDGNTCVNANNCQDNMIDIRNSQVKLFAISTKASISMVTLNGQQSVFDRDNRNTFCGTIASFETS
ncbi:CAZyme family GH55 [Trichoderma aggressivum f. europaeum]|uniref:CAZyme family GH55 n=1 Tax=Trichoderma aggressivum f. europaeum TaxID=173218 RepID=A0AAE1IK61_9HYPO|nr:CAZyme family GH55 [Trichoderma aggressivum f. europaeum]